MKVWSVAQGTSEWLALRSGIPTASEFHRILSPTGEISKQAEPYMNRLLAEWVVGHPFDEPETEWMQRGGVLEDEAVKAYAFQKDVDVEKVGFITNDAGMVGCSPDRLVGDRGLLEAKNPKHNTHISYALTHKMDMKYKPQTQGQLWIAEREYSDLISYHPEMLQVSPSLGLIVIPITRDEVYIDKLEAAVNSFVEIMLQKRAELSEKYGPFVRLKKGADADPFGITEADFEQMMASNAFEFQGAR